MASSRDRLAGAGQGEGVDPGLVTPVAGKDGVMNQEPSCLPTPLWVRIGLVAVGLPNALAGLWGVLSPDGFYDNFPGWDPRLVAAEPPFNAHLAADAGAGLLASGVVLLAAAWLADRRSVRLALVAFAVFAVPHAAYHAFNPAPGLSRAEDGLNVAFLSFAVLAATVLFVGARSTPAGRDRGRRRRAGATPG